MEPDEDIQAALDALSDGHAFDWTTVAHGPADQTRATLRKLYALARIAETHQPPHPRLPAPPFRWKDLEVLGPLGRGTSGLVFLARDPRLDRQVALKLLPVHDVDAQARAAAALREGRRLARVRHPHVLVVHGADEDLGHVGVWTELVDGATLEEDVQQRGPLPAGEVIAIGRDLCGALQSVHDAGLVHGDVKASNVMRSSDGRVVLVDFGASREHGPDLAETPVGTPLYLAPEVLAGGTTSPASDVYALGVLLFRLLTARMPVEADTIANLRASHAAGRRIRLRAVGPAVPAALAAAIERALAADPSRRFATADAFSRALASPPPAASGDGLRLRLGALTTVALLCAAGWGVLWFGRAAADLHVTAGLRRIDLPPLLLTGRPSRDGRWLSYTDTDGNVAIRRLADGHARRLTTDGSIEGRGTGVAGLSAPSPDGRQVAFVWNGPAGPALRIAAATGARPVRTIVPEGRVRDLLPYEWSHDGRFLLVGWRRADGLVTLAHVRIADGTTRDVGIALPGFPEHASLSADGRWVAYDAPEAAGQGSRDLRIAATSADVDRVLAPHRGNDFAPIWAADGTHLLFLSDRGGTLDLWSQAVADGTPVGLPTLARRSVARMYMLGMTDTGTLLHYQVAGAVDVYVSPADRLSPTPVADQFVGMNMSPRWSPDGRTLAYVSRRGVRGPQGGDSRLVLHDLNIHATRELVPPLSSFQVSDWSPDGRQILLHGFDATGRIGLHALDPTRGTMTTLVRAADEHATVGMGCWLADGRLIYRGDHDQLRARDTDGRDSLLFDARAAGYDGLVAGAQGRGWRGDPAGRRLAFSAMRTDGSRRVAVVGLVDLASGAVREAITGDDGEVVILQDWTPDGRALLHTRRVRDSTQPPGLWRHELESGAAHLIGAPMPLRDVSSDPTGQRIAFTAGAAQLEVWALSGLPH